MRSRQLAIPRPPAKAWTVAVGVWLTWFLWSHAALARAGEDSPQVSAGKLPVIEIAQPQSPPRWAVLERELLAANAAACREFYDHYVDERGWLRCVERWGGDDGPDDASECFADWPLAYALGCDSVCLDLARRAWEGHLQQYTAARTRDVELARDGMYQREFPTQFDWLHHAEGLTAFLTANLAESVPPQDQARLERFARFYTGEDSAAPNYDRRHRLIRSLFNGSRGPLLRPTTALDWAGDPFDVRPFRLHHGERSFDEMLAHFRDYREIVGDHPQNLCATALGFSAYALTGQAKYRDWVLEYVDAWLERMDANGGIIPTNIGLDGVIGSSAGGKWYGGVYGWGFSVEVPQTGELAHRNTHHLALAGIGYATILSGGDPKYYAAWRRQIELINAQAKIVDGVPHYPHMFGDQGWYDFTPQPYTHGAREAWYFFGQAAAETAWQDDGWLAFLAGRDERYPEQLLQAGIDSVAAGMARMRADDSTPETRLADDPLANSPVSIAALVPLMWGGFYPGHAAAPLQVAVRYFDPVGRRAGLPPDVAALVRHVAPEEVTLSLINLSPDAPRRLLVQAGAYAEHEIGTAVGPSIVPVEGRYLEVDLAPGAGGEFRLSVRRFAHQPTLAAPWSERPPRQVGADEAIARAEPEELFRASPLTAEGLFTAGIEGPGCDAAGNIYVVNFQREQTIGRVTPRGEADLFVALPGVSTGNGIVFDRAGSMFVADYVGHNVLKIDPKTRQVSVLAHDDRMNQPNDLAIAADGTLYASDPAWKVGDGQLWKISRDGKTARLAQHMGTTNGLDLSPDGKTLYVNESVQRNVWAFPVLADGTLGEKRLLRRFDDFGFDGMRCDVDGNLYITRHGKGTVVKLSPTGEILCEVDVLGTKPSNLCFGGPDGRTVYVTEVEHTRLVQFRVDRPGLAWQRWQQP